MDNTLGEGLYREGNLYIERVAIRKPVWGGRKVGIARFRAERCHIIEVKILYRLKKSKDTKELIPELLRMPSTKVLGYPRQRQYGVELCLVPLADFQMV